METNSETSELLSVAGPKEISFRSGSGLKLEERWNGGEGAKKLEEINDFYAMGQSLKLNSVPEVVNYLTMRDYPNLYDYNGKKK